MVRVFRKGGVFAVEPIREDELEFSDSEGDLPPGHWLEKVYDDEGRLIEEFEYDSEGNLTRKWKYNKDERPVEEVFFGEDGIPTSKIIFGIYGEPVEKYEYDKFE